MTTDPDIQIDTSSLRAGDFLAYWNDLSSSLTKWLLATLITVNTGGMFVALNSKVHPDAIDSALGFFFLGLSSALLAGTSEVIRASLSRDKLLAHVTGASKSGRAFQIEGRSWRSYALAIAFSIISLGFFAFGGSTLAGSTRPCSAEDLNFSIDFGDNIAPGAKGRSRPCYFYHIEGLPDEPLERAVMERDLIRRINAIESNRSIEGGAPNEADDDGKGAEARATE